jgi:hypothetical protein
MNYKSIDLLGKASLCMTYDKNAMCVLEFLFNNIGIKVLTLSLIESCPSVRKLKMRS